jgi:hypothetical protein
VCVCVWVMGVVGGWDRRRMHKGVKGAWIISTKKRGASEEILG